jgi:hypothetical protein
VETLQAFGALFQIPHYYRKFLYCKTKMLCTSVDKLVICILTLKYLSNPDYLTIWIALVLIDPNYRVTTVTVLNELWEIKEFWSVLGIRRHLISFLILVAPKSQYYRNMTEGGYGITELIVSAVLPPCSFFGNKA